MYFSARSASWAPLLFQQMTRCHSVFSCFSPPCPVHWRLVARERFATREPLVVLRTSGSAPKFPNIMTLFRLRLTTGLQTIGGRGPRVTTVYESQVILSIKDTPLGLKFCRYLGGQALGKIVRRPGVREDRALDRGDGCHVSRLGGTDPVGGDHGGPPISPALRPDGRRPARPRESHRVAGSLRLAGRATAAW